MPNVASTRYACYARFTFSAVNYAVSTDEGYRSSSNHDPVLSSDVDLASQFRDGGVVDGNSLTLTIADGIGGTYRTLVAGSVLDGTVAGSVLDGTLVTVETVCTLTYDDGTTAEQAVTQVLTVQGARLEPGRVHLSLVDLEDDKLNALYPSALYSADTFRDIDGGFAGRAIPFPIGTCRKFDCPQLFADAVTPQYFFGVCDADMASLYLPITAISTGSKTFTVSGDYTGNITAGTVFFSDLLSANPGRYTTVSAVYSAPNTIITVSETIASASVSGGLEIPPTVLAVYRDGRLVASSEYTVHIARAALGQVGDSDFDNSPATWTGTGAGTGIALLTGGRGRVTGDGGTANYGRLNTAEALAYTVPGAYVLATITLATGARVRLYGATISAGTVVVGAGTHTVPVLQEHASGYTRVSVSNYNTAYSGTVEVDDLSLNTTQSLVMLKFAREQVGFDGRPYAITADVRGVSSRNVINEIGRLINAAGGSNGGSFSTAITYANTNGMLVDVDHGAGKDGGQRTLRALLDDLLFIARATLNRGSTGAYEITQDKTGTTAATLNEDAGDLIEVTVMELPPKPLSVGIRFAPNARDPSNVTYSLTRAVTGGVLAAEQPRDVRYLTDATAADRLVCYLALRAQYNARLKFRELQVSRSIGQVLNITSTPTFIGARDWFIDSVKQMPGGQDMEARQYNAAVHTYTAGTLPNGATTAYQPDYSQTPPAAPSAMTITAGSVATAGDGTMTARITAKATPPSVNWAELWLTCIHNTTNEISALVRADSIGGGEYGATLSGLRPGEVYKLQSYAVNAFAVQGVVQSIFNATAISGGASVTTFTAPGQTSVPANVSSISRAQGIGRLVDVNWPAVSGAAIWGYILERDTGGGYAEVWRGQSTSYRDTNVSIGNAYLYRVKARDTYGNVSASWTTSTSLTLVSNVNGGNGTGDLNNDTVESSNRTATNTFSVAYTNPGALQVQTQSITHSLGKIPLLTIDTAGKAAVMVALKNVTTSAADVLILGTGSGETSDEVTPAAGVLHGHLLMGFTEAGTAYVRVW